MAMKASEAEIDAEETIGAGAADGGMKADAAGAAEYGVNAGAEIERDEIGRDETECEIIGWEITG